MRKMKKIFYVEDDQSINRLIGATLEHNNFDVEGFLEPISFLKRLETFTPELIILDLMLPKISGFDVLKRLKEDKRFENIPVIILSARSEEQDIVKGLDMGASDYITKPFGLTEFIARIHANVRKINMHEGKTLKIRDLSVDTLRHQVFYKDELMTEITTKEYEVLEMLLESPSIVVTRTRLLKDIWGFTEDIETRTLDMHIKSIRMKLQKFTDEEYIETIRGVGYIIKE